MGARILVVDDEQTVREELCEALREAGFETVEAGDARQALERTLHDSYDVCLTDLRMPGMDGIELLRRLGEQCPETLVVIITAHGEMQTAIEALRLGAADYLLKPVLFEDVIAKVQRLVEHRCLVREVRNLRRVAETVRGDSSSRMVGESAPMREILTLIQKVAPTRSHVLITGESGTGKELIARAIHEASEQPRAPFVPINCAAIPEMLLESELFGHMKGSFTGAVENKEGLLKTAEDGTIFLDELGEMPLPLQAKLLRAIEAKEIQPVGSVRRIPVRARVIAATNKNLPSQIEAGKFREDLYYRLAVVEVHVPALRDRREDIPVLARHFVDKYNRELRRAFVGIDNAAMARLMGYHWKGNIRELENTIERAMILSSSDSIGIEDLPQAVRGALPLPVDGGRDLCQAVRRFELQHIHRVIEGCQGDKRRAARMLGISLSSLYRKLDLQGSRGESAQTS